jgi:hypothetical protein
LHSRILVCVTGFALGLAACGGGGGSPPPPPPVLTLTGLPSAALAPNTTYQLSATETVGGSPVTPGTLTFKLDNPAVGTLTGTSLLTGVVNASGTITVTDASRNGTATFTVSVGTTHPLANGDAVTLAGTLAQTIVRPLPAPSATPPVFSSNATIAIATTTTTGATFNGAAGLSDLHSVEQDTTQSPAITTTTTTDAYESLVPNGSAFDVVTPGSAGTDSNGKSFSTVLGTGNGLLDILPETNGATFSNDAAATYSETDADGQTILRTTNADGTYSETDSYPDGTTQTVAVNADLSGSLTGFRGLAGINVTVAAPTTATPSTIAYSLSQPGPTPTSTPTVQTLSVNTWYPTTTLASDVYTTTLAQTIPTACAVPAGAGTTAVALAETVRRLDPVLGTFENRTTTSFLAPSYGLVCVQIADTLDDYYDYSGQSSSLIAVSSTPIQTTSIVETVGLKSATIGGATKLSTAVKTNSAAVAPSAAASFGLRPLAIARVSFERVVQRAYRERFDRLHRVLRSSPTLQQVVR